MDHRLESRNAIINFLNIKDDVIFYEYNKITWYALL